MNRKAAYAKLNLYLRVTGVRDNGYHELDMVNVRLDWADFVSIEDSPAASLVLSGDHIAGVPADESNLAWKAAEAYAGRGDGLFSGKITLEKNIPAGAGLGGGSADAAAVLTILAEQDSSIHDLIPLAKKLGADVPYCLFNSPARVRGIGEIVEPLTGIAPLHLVVANPGIPVSTPEIFAALDNAGEKPASETPQIEDLIAALKAGEPEAVARHLHNDLEFITCARHPEILDLMKKFKHHHAIAVRMTGSGSAVFGLYRSARDAQAAADALKVSAPVVRYAPTLRGDS